VRTPDKSAEVGAKKEESPDLYIARTSDEDKKEGERSEGEKKRSVDVF